ncbi:ABC transporter permease [Phytoactinopolyspora halotolerans]|uniref:ABC transporter permease n=1 Tax=Phytoactinopolyspora halotolerans TaxID=1981512 RepID=A0A6L9SGB7_9ACTN|nr:ABC transporter permease [Phytoactinopolyspora halotolerans]NEE04183.1 ABC transporter permease [Phytoactinopolyspora halotolerans]
MVTERRRMGRVTAVSTSSPRPPPRDGGRPTHSGAAMTKLDIESHARESRTPSSREATRAAQGPIGTFAGRIVREANLLIIPMILLIVALSFFSDAFFTGHNLTNILRTAAIFVILGVGQTFVITSKNIDLSIGSMMALVLCVTASLIIVQDWSPHLAVPFAIAMGAVLGVLNGMVVTKLKVPALLATLGGLIAYRGAVQEFMYGGQYVGLPEQILILGRGMWGPVPVPVAIAGFCVALGWLLFRYTRFGRYTVAIGSNEEAARRAGINVDRWTIGVFAFQGAMVGVAALVLMGRMNAANPNMGQLNELHVIAGVVLGGTLLFGGIGTILGTVLGLLFIGVLENGLLLAGAGFYWQQIFLGLLIILAVASQMLRIKLQGRH